MAMPRIRNSAERRKTVISVMESVISGVRFKITTISATGKTEINASLNL